MKKFLMFALAASVISSNTCIAASYLIQPQPQPRVIHILNPVPKHQPQPQPRVIHIVNPVPKHQPQPYAMQHTTPTGPTITIVEEDTVY